MNMPVSGFQPKQSFLSPVIPFKQPESRDTASETLQNNGMISYGANQSGTPFTLPESKSQGTAPAQRDPLQILQQLSQLIEKLVSSLFQKPDSANESGLGQNDSPACGNRGGSPSPSGDLTGQKGEQPTSSSTPAPSGSPAPTPTPGNQVANSPETTNTPVTTGGKPSEAITDKNSNIDPNKNSLTYENKGKEAYTISFTSNAENADAKLPDVTLQPGEVKTIEIPEGWGGNVRTNKGDGKNITLGEFKFNGGDKKDQAFYDVSYIEGFNSRMQIQPMQGGRVSGTLDDLTNGVPESMKARDQSGNAYGIKKTTDDNKIDGDIVKYYRNKVKDAEGYVVPDDNTSTLGTNSRNLKVDLM